VDPLIDYIEDARRRDRRFRMKDRTVRSILRAMNAWHGALARITGFGDMVFKTSGFKGQTWEQKGKGYHGQSSLWTIREITTAEELAAEGRAMRHCVASFAGMIERGITSIWSLRQDGGRRLTVEVIPSARAIVQARGKCNRLPTNAEKSILKNWAAQNGLKTNVSYF
jgi:hypothetical protein